MERRNLKTALLHPFHLCVCVCVSCCFSLLNGKHCKHRNWCHLFSVPSLLPERNPVWYIIWLDLMNLRIIRTETGIWPSRLHTAWDSHVLSLSAWVLVPAPAVDYSYLLTETPEANSDGSSHWVLSLSQSVVWNTGLIFWLWNSDLAQL